MDALTSRRAATAEFVLNVGPHAQAEVDTYRGGVPHLVISDGATDVLIKPHEDVPISHVLVFVESLAVATRAYADDLARTARDEAANIRIDR